MVGDQHTTLTVVIRFILSVAGFHQDPFGNKPVWMKKLRSEVEVTFGSRSTWEMSD